VNLRQAEVDVIIVGAGIVGACCAHELAARKLKVMVIDNHRGGATGAGMGHLVVMDDNPAELALSHYSIGVWNTLCEEMPEGCAYRNCGTLWLAANEDERELAEAKQAALTKHGVSTRWVNAARLRELEPMLRPDLVGALKVTGDGIVYAPAAVRWLLARHADRITVHEAEVVRVEDNRLCLGDGSWLTAPAVILANGIAATSLLPELPIRPKKGHLLITDRYPACIHHQLVELGYSASAHASDGTSVAFNVQPRPTGQLLIGSSRQFDTLDRAVEFEVLGRLLKRALHYLPAMGELNAIRSWTGFRAATPDGLPLLGKHPQQPGLWLALGHEGLGVTTAPGSARIIAAQLMGEAPPLESAPFLPERFLGVPSSSRAVLA
jgi:glycine/D-amino acid oxidase-like deaminating enzyme